MNILFVTSVQFPFGSASSARTRNIVKILCENNNRVHVIANRLSKEDIIIEGCTYEGLTSDLGDDSAVIKEIEHKAEVFIKKNNADILITNANSKRFNYLLAFCKKNSLKFVVENCEWFDPSNYRLGTHDKEYKENQKMIMHGFKEADAFISISRLLHKHNSGFNKPSVRIPTILDVKNSICRINTEGRNKIILVYTGRAGKSKEFLRPIMEAIAKNNTLQKNVEFHIYGPNELQILRNINYNYFLLKKTEKFVFVHGNVPQETMEKVIMDADYQIFLRPSRRSSDAGFPTKLGESMAVGTPVIANYTGDIELYLKDEETGFVLGDISVSEVEKVLLKITRLSSENAARIRKNARVCAEESFDYREYKLVLEKMLKGLFI